MSIVPKNPVAGLTEEQAIAWFAAPPTRSEIYAHFTAINTVASHILNATADLISENRQGALENLQQALSELRETVESLPKVDPEVLQALKSSKE